MNLASLLQRAGHVAATSPAISLGHEVIADYSELCASVMALSGGLASFLEPGARVALVMTNSPEYIEALFACWTAGLIVVPINARLHPRELAFILEDSGAGVVLTTRDLATNTAASAQMLPGTPHLFEVGSAGWRALSDRSPRHGRPPAQLSDPAWLFYTSGTTGRPKGAILTHRNLLTMSLSYLADVETVAPGDGLLHAAPMSHGSGLYSLPFVAGMAMQIIPESCRFEPGEILELARAHERVSFFAAPTMVRRLTAAAAACGSSGQGIKTLIYGGGPMYVEDCKAALDQLGPRLAQIYGQGETPMTITVLPKRLLADRQHPRWEERLSTVGYAAMPVEIRIGGEDGAAGTGEVGEILVRGDTVMSGYWNMPAASAETLRAGWLHTGDVGSLDAEGFLTLRDRAKDVIISGGSNIYPREVEEVLLRCPQVCEVSVVGRPHPDWGEEVVAFVVTQPGQTVSPEQLDTLCNSHIARFKRPKVYRFVTALPKNEYGKVLKSQLRTWALE